MEFWLHFLDLSINRKIKAFILATGLLFLDKISGDQWIIALGIYVAGNAYEKIAKMKGK